MCIAVLLLCYLLHPVGLCSVDVPGDVRSSSVGSFAELERLSAELFREAVAVGRSSVLVLGEKASG